MQLTYSNIGRNHQIIIWIKNTNRILCRLKHIFNIQVYSFHVETADTNSKLAGQLTESSGGKSEVACMVII